MDHFTSHRPSRSLEANCVTSHAGISKLRRCDRTIERHPSCYGGQPCTHAITPKNVWKAGEPPSHHHQEIQMLAASYEGSSSQNSKQFPERTLNPDKEICQTFSFLSHTHVLAVRVYSNVKIYIGITQHTNILNRLQHVVFIAEKWKFCEAYHKPEALHCWVH